MTRRKGYDKEYYRKNRERLRSYKSEWDKTHKEVRAKYRRRYNQKLKKWIVDKLERKCSKCGLVSEFDCIYDLHHTKDSKVEK